MPSHLIKPYPALDLTYDPATDAALCAYHKERCRAAVDAAVLKLRECQARLAAVSAAFALDFSVGSGDEMSIGSEGATAGDQVSISTGPIDNINAAAQAFATASRVLKAELHAYNTSGREIEQAMQREAYRQACEYVRDPAALAAREALDAAERAAAAQAIMAALDPEVRAVIGMEAAMHGGDGLQPIAGQLVGCCCFAESRRTPQVPWHSAAIVIRAEGEEHYCVALSRDGPSFGLAVVHRGCLRAFY